MEIYILVNTIDNMRRAFTLIELIVAMSIIGILATIAIPIYERMILKSRADEAKAMIQAIVFAQERYKQERGKFYVESDGVIKNENAISENLKIKLSESNNFNYYIEELNTSQDGNFTVKAILRPTSWGICTDTTISTKCKHTGAENVDSWVLNYNRAEDKHFIKFQYPLKLTGEYIDSGIDYEHLYDD
jgi:type IV pilus assembly protein PilE